MNTASINSETTHGNLGLEQVLNSLALADGLPATEGNTYVVIPATDTAYGEYVNRYQEIYADGTARIQTSLSSAYDATTTNRGDVILLSGSGAHAVTSMLTISKSRIHFVGMNLRGGNGVGMGARSRITMGDSTVAADIALMQNTGVGNTFDNIKFDSSSTEALSIWGVAEGGEYTIYRNCEFYKSTDLAVTLSGELLENGDSCQYINCSFGSSANAVTTGIIHPCVEFKREVIAGRFSRDAYFKDCLFLRYAGGTANSFVDATGVNDVNRMAMFKNCDFVANEIGSVPAEAITCSGGKQERGAIMLSDSTCFNCTLMTEASVGVFVSGPTSVHNTSGIAKDG